MFAVIKEYMLLLGAVQLRSHIWSEMLEVLAIAKEELIIVLCY